MPLSDRTEMIVEDLEERRKKVLIEIEADFEAMGITEQSVEEIVGTPAPSPNSQIQNQLYAFGAFLELKQIPKDGGYWGLLSGKLAHIGMRRLGRECLEIGNQLVAKFSIGKSWDHMFQDLIRRGSDTLNLIWARIHHLKSKIDLRVWISEYGSLEDLLIALEDESADPVAIIRTRRVEIFVLLKSDKMLAELFTILEDDLAKQALGN